MLKFAAALPNQLSGEKNALDVEKWPAAWQALGSNIAGVNQRLFLANKSITAIEADITALDNAQQTGTTAGQPQRQIVISVEATAPIDGNLSIAYQTYGASWRPVYDARLITTGAAPEVELTRRAAVTQTTGEDWTNVALTLATVSLNRSTAAPSLDTLAVSIYNPQDNEAKADGRLMEDQPVPATAAVAPEPLRKERAAPKPAEERSASVDLTAYQASFTVKDRVTIDTDGVQKSMVLGRSTEKPELTVKTVPALDATGYLQASFINTGEAPFLPGIVNLRRDDTFIGRGSIEATPQGEKLALGFGVDDLIKVTRVPLRRRENDPNPTGNKTSQEDFRTTVKNLHDFPVTVTILDRLPVSENSAITVEALPTNTVPTEKIVDQKRGVSGWTYEIKPQEAKDVRFGWRLRYPADRSLNWMSVAN
jgi:uncharacterized protein (TIGR02231 family)